MISSRKQDCYQLPIWINGKILDKTKDQKPSLTDWSVTSTVVTNMRRIVGSIIKNQASVGKLLISDVIMDTMRVYVYCFVDEVDEAMNTDLEHMVEEKDGLGEARQPRRNMEEPHIKMWENVKRKLAN